MVERAGFLSVSFAWVPTLKIEGEDWKLCPGKAAGLREVTWGTLSMCPILTLLLLHHRVQKVISGRFPAGAGEGQVSSLVKKEVQRILGHMQAPPRPFLLR